MHVESKEHGFRRRDLLDEKSTRRLSASSGLQCPSRPDQSMFCLAIRNGLLLPSRFGGWNQASDVVAKGYSHVTTWKIRYKRIG